MAKYVHRQAGIEVPDTRAIESFKFKVLGKEHEFSKDMREVWDQIVPAQEEDVKRILELSERIGALNVGFENRTQLMCSGKKNFPGDYSEHMMVYKPEKEAMGYTSARVNKKSGVIYGENTVVDERTQPGVGFFLSAKMTSELDQGQGKAYALTNEAGEKNTKRFGLTRRPIKALETGGYRLYASEAMDDRETAYELIRYSVIESVYSADPTLSQRMGEYLKHWMQVKKIRLTPESAKKLAQKCMTQTGDQKVGERKAQRYANKLTPQMIKDLQGKMYIVAYQDPAAAAMIEFQHIGQTRRPKKRAKKKKKAKPRPVTDPIDSLSAAMAEYYTDGEGMRKKAENAAQSGNPGKKEEYMFLRKMHKNQEY